MAIRVGWPPDIARLAMDQSGGCRRSSFIFLKFIEFKKYPRGKDEKIINNIISVRFIVVITLSLCQINAYV
jgi:hypothetical protein